MKRSICAARALEARRRIEAATERLAAQLHIEPPSMDVSLKGTPDVVEMKRLELIADALEALAAVPEPGAPVLVDAIRAASDDELLDLPGIGTATLKALREGL